MKRSLLFVLAVSLCCLLPLTGVAGEYPDKPINFINPLPPGGTLDLQARAIAGPLGKYLGEKVVVVNKTGAAGAVGTVAGMTAKPDGYTLLEGWSAQTSLMIGELLAGRKPAFGVDDFEIIGRFTDSPPLFLVPYDSPYQTIQEALAAIKANPGKFAFSSGGIYSISHLPMEILLSELDLKMRHVPFQGGGPAFTALIGKHVQFSAQFPGSSLPKVKAKQLRALACFGEKRIKNYEDVPTFKELGYEGVLYTSWVGLLAPKGIPAPILAKLREATQKAVHDPLFNAVIEKAGDQVRYADAETHQANWKKEFEKMKTLLFKIKDNK